MAVEVGKGYVGIGADVKSLQATLTGLGTLLGGKLGAAGALLGNQLGSKMGKGIEENLGGAKGGVGGLVGLLGAGGPWGAAAAAAVAATAGVGIGLYKLGENFDTAYRTIARRTGDTGGQLKVLKQSFNDVLRTTPASMEAVSQAVIGVQRYTGAAQKPLTDLSRQLVTLSRISGTDVTSNTEAGIRALERWNIPVKQAKPLIDALFTASQKSGVGFSDLAQQVTQFQPQMTAMGYSFKDSVTMLASWGKSGVNTSRIMMGMQMAAAKLAGEQGKGNEAVAKAQSKLDAAELKAAATTGPAHVRALQDVFKAQVGLNEAQKNAAKLNAETIPDAFRTAVDQIKHAKTPMDALNLAVDLFGKRGAVQMVSAIRSGKFNFDEMKKSVDNSNDSIAETANKTRTVGGAFGKLRNQAEVELQPVSTKVFGALRIAMIDTADYLSKNMPGAIHRTSEAFKDAYSFISQWTRRIYEAITPLRHTIGDIFVAGFRTLRTAWNLAQPVLEAIGRTFILLKDIITGNWGDAWNQVKGILGDAGRALARLPEMMYRLVTLPFSLLGAHVTDALNGFWNVLTTIPGKVWGFLSGLPQLVWNLISYAFGVTKSAAETGLKDIWTWLTALPLRIIFAIGDLGGWVWRHIQGAFGRALSAITSGLANIWGWLGQLPGMISGAMGDIGGWVWNHLAHAFGRMLDGIQWGAQAVWGWLSGMPSRVVNAMGDVGTQLWNYGTHIMDRLADGITSAAGHVWDAVSHIAGGILSHFPHSPAKMGPLSGSGDPVFLGRNVANRLTAGLTQGQSQVNAALTSMLTVSPGDLTGLGGGAAVPVTGALGGRGPAVVVQNANFTTNLDVEQFMRQAAWAAQTQGL